ncbi:phage protease [Pseudomonas qingdaonensis]|nr:phage protease [Pseudomonas qingdaonensis]
MPAKCQRRRARPPCCRLDRPAGDPRQRTVGPCGLTPRAGEQVAAREYRFVSPVFDYDDAYRRVLRMVSVGLTNKPNLVLTASTMNKRRRINWLFH